VGQAVLAGLLGLSRGDLAWKVAGELPAPHSLPDMASLLEKAMGERLDARIAGLRIAAARAELKRQQGSVVPSVGLGFEYERADSPPNLRGPTADLTIPAWDQNQAQIAKAAVLIARQEREYEDALNAVAQDVHKAAAAARAGADIVQFYDHESLPLSDGNVQSAARAYETGLTDILRLTQAQRTLIEQRQAYVAAMREYAIAVADLEQAVGGRLGEAAAAPAPSPEAPEAASPNP